MSEVGRTTTAVHFLGRPARSTQTEGRPIARDRAARAETAPNSHMSKESANSIGAGPTTPRSGGDWSRSTSATVRLELDFLCRKAIRVLLGRAATRHSGREQTPLRGMRESGSAVGKSGGCPEL